MTTADERGFQLFTDLQETMLRTTATMERLDAEQKNQCRIIEQAAEKASKTAEDAAEAFAVSKPRLMTYAALCALMLVCVGWFVGGWMMYRSGWATGDANGYKRAIEANAAASWANTPSGQLALEMDKDGLLQPLAHCHLPGYEAKYDPKAKRSFCYPRQNPSGWAVTP